MALEKKTDLAKEIRTVTFGVGSMMNVVCVQPPKSIHDCGMYIHMSDIPKFLAFQKQLQREEAWHDQTKPMSKS